MLDHSGISFTADVYRHIAPNVSLERPGHPWGSKGRLASAFTSAYQPGRGWQVGRLDQLAPVIAMTGAEVRLVDPSGKLV